jgi:esterase/lipase superfamily enzyme
MNLYQTTQLAQLQNYVDEETGEIDIDSFNRSQIALADKQLAVVCYLKNEDANIKLLDGAITELTARKKAMQNRHDSLKDYLLVNMQANGITEISAPNYMFTAKLQHNPVSVIIDDESLIEDCYKTIPPPPVAQISKTLIKEAIQGGDVVPGAHLESKMRVVIK